MSCPHKHVEEEQAAQSGGSAYWKTLEERANTPEFHEYLHREFPRQASVWTDESGVSRRNFMKVMGASLALAGVGGMEGCARQPAEAIVPYVDPPEQIVAGRAMYFATTMPFRGYGIGVLAESHEGRPTKIEGNPDHPASLGATSSIVQASVLDLYDPDRSKNVMKAGEISTWATFIGEMREALKRQVGSGAGVRILTETITSPTLAQQIKALLAKYPQAKWHQYDASANHNARAGAMAAFGRAVETVYRFDQAKRILSLDGDFLLHDPGSLRYAREFVNSRRLRRNGKETWRENVGKLPQPIERAGDAEMNRLYVVESSLSLAGAMADHRIGVRPSEVEEIARAIAGRIGVGGTGGDTAVVKGHEKWITAVAADLMQAKGASLVVAGECQPPAVHVLAHAMNAALGNAGKTIVYSEPADANPVDQIVSLRELVSDMNAGRVDTLIILSANPCYTAPVDLGLSEPTLERNPLGKVRLRIRFGSHYDETSYFCDWHVPESHYLESWGDLRAFDGTASIVQPLISPLYNASRSSLEFVSVLLGEERSAYEILRESWRARGGNADFETFWAAALRKGTIPSSASGPVNVTFNAGALSHADRRSTGPNNALELTFRLDPNLLDGRYANNGWLQEVPKPFTQLTWDNAAIMSPATARRLNLESRRIVHLQLQGGDVTAPVWVQPGHPDDSVTVHLGYGRSRAGHVGGMESERVGFNANLLRTADAMSFAVGLKIIATEEFFPMACTQTHQSLEGRELVRVRTAEQVRAGFAGVAAVGSEPQGVRNERSVKLSLYPDYYSGDKNHQFTPDKGHQWGMVIDNNACIGCTACVTACVAENNIPVVGKDQVIREREMHWIRIDTYYKGEGDDPDGPYFEPMLCQHCENAPCEIVCPVEATSHSAEGLNEMTYNRCIGTRYCSNNCPYKVRRFNFLQYTDTQTPQIKMQRNPNVTVRKRGVMEKCTYCVQRINRTRIDLKRLDVQRTESTDPDIVTQLRQQMDDLMRDLQPACQQACPTEAIIFGDLNWKFKDDSAPYVVQLKEQIENFGILAELNTNPRTTYLPHLRNPNPALVMENAGGAPVPHS